MTEATLLPDAAHEAETPATPRRDNRAASRRLCAELDAIAPHAPISELGRRLECLRKEYIAAGGQMLGTEEEFRREVRRYRFGIDE